MPKVTQLGRGQAEWVSEPVGFLIGLDTGVPGTVPGTSPSDPYWIVSFNPQNKPMRRYTHPHFIDEATGLERLLAWPR